MPAGFRRNQFHESGLRRSVLDLEALLGEGLKRLAEQVVAAEAVRQGIDQPLDVRTTGFGLRTCSARRILPPGRRTRFASRTAARSSGIVQRP